MNPCTGDDWNPLGSSEAFAAFEGLLAGFVFSAVIFLIPARVEQTRRVRTLYLFISAFVVLAFASYLAARGGGDTVCLRALTANVIESSLLGVGAVSVMIGITWLIDSYLGDDDNGRSLGDLLVAVATGVAAVVAVLLPLTAEGYWRAAYTDPDGWTVTALAFAAANLVALGVVFVLWYRGPAPAEADQEPPARSTDVGLAVRVGAAGSCAYALFSAVTVGAVTGIPNEHWDPTPAAWLPAAVGLSALVIPPTIMVIQLLALPERRRAPERPTTGEAAATTSSPDGADGSSTRPTRRAGKRPDAAPPDRRRSTQAGR